MMRSVRELCLFWWAFVFQPQHTKSDRMLDTFKYLGKLLHLFDFWAAIAQNSSVELKSIIIAAGC